MKLIKGATLDALLNGGEVHPSGSLDVLAIFEAISQAVGYAHARGVIHRDLKPANIMVGAFGEVQVMDWGLAKLVTDGWAEPCRPAIDPEAATALTEIRSLRDPDIPLTQYGSVLGTPAYMSPEQAGGETDKVDRRSDVFGLGAILCVLLTGKPPFEGKDSEAVRLNAVRGQTAAAFARLDAGGADPDVVSLCKRCLAFEPVDRPATADEVAAAVAALRREADDRARQAERDKLAAEVQAAEQAKRRRAVQWAAGGVAAVLLLGVAGTTIGLLRANASRRDAETARRAEAEQRRAAEAKEAEANAVVRFFENKVFAAARPKGQYGGLGKDVTLRDAIAASLPALGTGFADQPLVEARLRRTLGATFIYLGNFKAAIEQYERARAIFAEWRLPEHPGALGCMTGLAVSHGYLGRYAEAVRLHEEALTARRRVLPPDHPDTLWSLHHLAHCYSAVGRHVEALKLHEEALAACRRVLPLDHPDILWSLRGVAESLVRLDRGEEAVAVVDECVSLGAGEIVDPRMIPTLMDLRLRHFQRSDDPAGCRATAEIWEDLKRTDAEGLYAAAGMRAVAAALHARANQQAEDTEDADRAMTWLTRAVAAGFNDRDRMEEDNDLDSLRTRTDFRKLVESMPDLTAPPPR
jgi:tetratricopeptide (TPR) repeat protein